MLAESAGPISIALAFMTPLVAVPLTLITFYLRTLREHQIAAHAQLERRVETCESRISEVRRALSERDRDFATKEEWLRETMYARRMLDELRDAVTRRSTRRTLRAGRNTAGDGTVN